ncbi:flippase [Halocatena pleomorpha]|uniref:Flippase n=1 Tax=Halocatena pleomorpha TaxID=1785090 RepID=A0A3P3RCC1_9EURY|nr:flippase [Halocatena pleomorpha]RRJ30340.1 flippase [Halocatena pleomorpha]
MSSDSDDALTRVASGGGIVLLGVVLELGISFLAKLLIARVLGPVNYGVVSLGVTTMVVVSTLVLLGLHTGVGRYLPRFEGTADRRGVVVSAFQTAVPLAVAAGGLVYVFAPVIATAGFSDPAVTPVLRVFGLVIPLAAVMKLAIGTSRGLQQVFPKVSIRNIVLPVVRFTAVIVVLWLGFDALGVAWAYAIAYTGAMGVGLYFLWRDTDLFAWGSPATPVRRELLAFSAPLVISTAMTFVFSDIDTFMLGYFSSTGDVGIYNTVYPLAHLLAVPMSSFGFIVMPVVSKLHERGEHGTVRQLYQTTSKWIFLASFPVFAVIVLFPTHAISLTFGPAYADGSLALVVLAGAFFTHAIAGPNFDLLTSIGRTRLIMYDDTFVALLNVGLNLLLIPRYSFLGAAIATTIAYVLMNVLYSLQLYFETGIQPLTPALLRTALLGTTTIAVLYGIVQTLFTVTVSVFLGTVVVFGLVYLIVVVRVAIEPQEVELLLDFEERFDLNLGVFKQLVSRLRS